MSGGRYWCVNRFMGKGTKLFLTAKERAGFFVKDVNVYAVLVVKFTLLLKKLLKYIL